MSYDPRDYPDNDEEFEHRTWTPRRVLYLIIAILIILSLLLEMASSLLTPHPPPPPTPMPMIRPGDRI